MITEIFGEPGAGKTGLMTFLLNEAAFDRERNFAMQSKIEFKNACGFDLTVPQHCVYANYDVTFRKPGRRKRKNLIVNPSRLGFQNGAPKGVKTQFILPYATIGIDEAQKYFYSKGGASLPTYRSNFFEEHRHNDLNIYLAVQRARLIDKNLRDLAQGYHVINRDVRRTRKGGIMIRWTVNVIPIGDIDRYLDANPKEKKQYYSKQIFECPYDIYKLYDSQGCEYRFYEGHMNEDFELRQQEVAPILYSEYLKFMQNYDDSTGEEK